MAKAREDLTGRKYNDWEVLKMLPNRKCLCRCSCGTEREQYISNLKRGITKSCGHQSNKVGVKINSWEIIEELEDGIVRCRCECGNVQEIYKKVVLSGESKSCGCSSDKWNDLTGKRFGEWNVKKYIGNQLWECECSCGTIANVLGALLVNGVSISCGCTRDRDYALILKDRNRFTDIIKRHKIKPTLKELSETFNIKEDDIYYIIDTYDLNNYVEINNSYIKYKQELTEYIMSICSENILMNDRDIDVDLYIPKLNIAIDFNNNCLDSDKYTDKNYHLLKLNKLNGKEIRLIHIFEYEWDNNKARVQTFLNNVLSTKSHVIYARNTKVGIEINKTKVKEFIDRYHIQGYAQSSVDISIKFNDEIIGLMTFGKPRFIEGYDWEIVRICFLDGVRVVGGTEKMFKYFLSKYSPNSIISYCDIAKFRGGVYGRLGFELIRKSEPNYVWINTEYNSILKRYQTQKHRLINRGLGTAQQTEIEIMRSHGYNRVFDCGNMVLAWEK